MKTLELTTLPSPVLLVWGLPEYCNKVSNYTLAYIARTKLGLHDWQLIGELSELTEEQAKTLAKSKDYPCYSSGDDGMYPEFTHNEIVYVDYEGDESDYKDTALESFHSAIEAEGHYVTNPVPAPECVDAGPYGGGYDSKWIKEYEEAQSKTLPANTLIFKRV